MFALQQQALASTTTRVANRSNTRSSTRVLCRAEQQKEHAPLVSRMGGALVAAAAAALTLSASPALAAPKLPPIDPDPQRCSLISTGNTIGQANAVSNKLLDARQCDLRGSKLRGVNLAGVVMDKGTNLQGSDMQEAVLTKAFAEGADLSGSDLTNSVLDRVIFDGANLSGIKFINAVITGCTFEGADLSNSTFEDALIGSEDAKRLCANPTLVGNARFEVGCRK